MTDTFYVLSVIAGLGLVSAINRSFFFLSRRELPLPDALMRGLRYAPLAALMAVIAPEIVPQSDVPWRDARPWAALSAAIYGTLRRDILGTIVIGMATLWLIKLGLGW